MSDHAAPVDLLVVPKVPSLLTIFIVLSFVYPKLARYLSISTNIPFIVAPVGIVNPKFVALR